MKNTPQFLIAAPTSGSGKTTISRGLMSLLARKGLKVQPFKCGPDYIDTKYHTAVCKRPSINLDTFMASKEHVCQLYARYAADADACVVEGMMGMYDGYDRDKGSSAEIADLLNLPVVLVVDAKSTAYSMAPLLFGFIHFRPDIKIAGVIFNRVGSPRHYEMLREVCIELNVTCLGYLPKQQSLEQESRYLGLDFSQSKCTDALDELTDLIEQHIDWQLLVEKTKRPLPKKSQLKNQEQGNLRILVARNEESFSFLYEEHLEILRRLGTVTFFNPEHNRPISKQLDLLYLPGGYPEKGAVKLEKAWRAKESIANYIEAGGKVLAECGGMMYLATGIWQDHDSLDADRHGYNSMVGIFSFHVSTEKKTRKLTLGYRQLDYNGQHLRGHEFHYSQFLTKEKSYDDFDDTLPPSVAQVCNAKGQMVDAPVFRYKNVIASYTHLYWGEVEVMKLF